MPDVFDASTVRVLIVEDEAVTAMDISEVLTGIGYQVVGPVGTGDEALALAVAERPDIALMDIMIRGEMDGIEAARQLESSLGISVIYLTAFSDSDILARAALTLPWGFLLKPFTDRELHVALQMALHHETHQRQRAQLVQRLEAQVAELSAQERMMRAQLQPPPVQEAAQLAVESIATALGADEVELWLSALRGALELAARHCDQFGHANRAINVRDLAEDESSDALRVEQGELAIRLTTRGDRLAVLWLRGPWGVANQERLATYRRLGLQCGLVLGSAIDNEVLSQDLGDVDGESMGSLLAGE